MSPALSQLPLLLALLPLAATQDATGAPWPAQEPFWPHYPSRKVTTLSGAGSFGFVRDAPSPPTLPYSAIVTPNTTAVPGSFDVAPPGVMGPVGTAFFRSTHSCTAGAPALLKFYAVNQYARVFVDSVELGNHTAGGYTPFEMVAPPCGAGGSRELALVTNNARDATMSPTYTGGDFYFYSGVIRPVVVTELPCDANPWIRRIEPITIDAVQGLIDIRVVLGAGLCPNTSPLPASVRLSVGWHGGAPGAPQDVAVVDGVAVVKAAAVPQPWAPWTVGGGGAGPLSLVRIQVVLAASGDSVMVRTGVRIVAVNMSSARVTVNGRAVKLLGYNRHTIWADTGASVTPAQEAIDVEKILAVNANYIRGAHYPQSQSFLDLCDENGIAVWEEALGPGTSTKDMQTPYFMANTVAAISSMVQTSIAHPSVFLHGFFNEGPSNDAAACTPGIGYAEAAATVRKWSGSPPARLVTWANDHTTSDVCIAHEDVISFNSYPGWYDSDHALDDVLPFWLKQIDWVASTHPTMPFTVSETGGGGVFEWLNASAPFPGVYWSQEYQRNLVKLDASVLSNHSRVSGLTLWQFSDIKVAQCAQCP